MTSLRSTRGAIPISPVKRTAATRRKMSSRRGRRRRRGCGGLHLRRRPRCRRRRVPPPATGAATTTRRWGHHGRPRGDRDRRSDLLRQLLAHGVDGVGRLRAPLGGLSVVFLLLYGVEFIRLQQERVDCKVQDELVISYSYQGYYFGVQIHVVKGLRERGFSSRNL